MSAEETPKVPRYDFEYRVVGTEEWKRDHGILTPNTNPYVVSYHALKFVNDRIAKGEAIEARQVIVE